MSLDDRGILNGVILVILWIFSYMIILPAIGYTVAKPNLPDNASSLDVVKVVITSPTYIVANITAIVLSLIVAVVLTIVLTRIFKKGVGER